MANRETASGSGGAITPMKIVAVEASAAPAAEVDGDTDPAPPPNKAAGTDPGVAPPAGVVAKGRDPQRAQVRVPGAGMNDSVDELLGNMAEPPKPPPKMSPESAGKAAAMYHAQHALHPAQLTPVPEPKVIVERSAQIPTVRLDRSKIPVSDAPPPMKRVEPTIEIPRAQGPRVVIALFAAVIVVFGIFVVLKLWSVKQKQNALATDPTASALVEPSPSAAVGAGAAGTVAQVEPAPTSTDTPSTPTAGAATEPPAPTEPAATASHAPATTATAKLPPSTTSTAGTSNPWASPPDTVNPYPPSTAAPPAGTSTGTAPKNDVKRTLN